MFELFFETQKDRHLIKMKYLKIYSFKLLKYNNMPVKMTDQV